MAIFEILNINVFLRKYDEEFYYTEVAYKEKDKLKSEKLLISDKNFILKTDKIEKLISENKEHKNIIDNMKLLIKLKKKIKKEKIIFDEIEETKINSLEGCYYFKLIKKEKEYKLQVRGVYSIYKNLNDNVGKISIEGVLFEKDGLLLALEDEKYDEKKIISRELLKISKNKLRLLINNLNS